MHGSSARCADGRSVNCAKRIGHRCRTQCFPRALRPRIAIETWVALRWRDAFIQRDRVAADNLPFSIEKA